MQHQIGFLSIAAAFVVTSFFPSSASSQVTVSSQGKEFQAELHNVAVQLMAAHGGEEEWNSLVTMSVARTHHYAGQAEPMRFNIHAEYETERNYQLWEDPAGEVVWDGERGWSVNWPLAEALAPRFVAGIGFYLINLPWYVTTPEAELISSEMRSGLSPADGRKYRVLTVQYEGAPRRRPIGQSGGDTLDLFIDPETNLLAGVHMHWRYAGQLDKGGLEDRARTEIYQGYVVHSYVTHRGMKLPNEYTIYASDGSIQAEGRYFDYQFDTPIEAEKFIPELTEGVIFDNSSSYLRLPHRE